MTDLRSFLLSVLALTFAPAGSACHAVEVPPPPVPVVQRDLEVTIEVAPGTEEQEVVVRRHDMGLGNRFSIRAGASFAAWAEGFLARAFREGPAHRLEVELVECAVSDPVVRMTSRFVLSREGEVVLAKDYVVDGPSTRDPAAVGEFGRTSLARQEYERSLAGALRLTFEAFLADLDAHLLDRAR